MSKKLALFLSLFLILLLGWSLFGPWGGLAVTVNGHVVRGPLGMAVGLGGVILTVVILFCVAILLAFVFAGVGLVILGVLAFVGVILIAVSLPLLLPLMIPLFIVWLFCAMLRKGKGTEISKP